MKIHHYILATTVSLAFSSCLDTEPETAISGEGVINDELTTETVLIGAYDAVQDFVGVSITAFNRTSDNVVGFSSSGEVVPRLSASGSSAFDPTYGGGYRYYYQAINVLNQLIADVPNVADSKFTGNSKKNKLAESYFLRALAYFGLARTYGGVPIVLEPSTSGHSADGIERSTYSATLDQVEADLNKAESLFDASLPTRARASIWATYALKARLYLYRENWAKAEEYASKVIDNSAFSLTPEVKDFYETALSSTSIFELVFNTSDKNPIFTYYLPAGLGGRLDYVPYGELVQILLDEEVSGKRNQLIARQSADSDQYVVQQYGKTDGTSSLPVLRLEEQYLIRAEARAQQDKLSSSADDINVIRNRAGISLIDATNLSKQDVLLVIENERRLELAFDGHRYSDIIRTGRAAEVFGSYNEIYKDSRYWVFPIPYSAITSDSDLVQNPGY